MKGKQSSSEGKKEHQKSTEGVCLIPGDLTGRSIIERMKIPGSDVNVIKLG